MSAYIYVNDTSLPPFKNKPPKKAQKTRSSQLPRLSTDYTIAFKYQETRNAANLKSTLAEIFFINHISKIYIHNGI